VELVSNVRVAFSLGNTKHRMLLLLLDGETSTDALASRLRMNPSVVRRHLDDLEASGLVSSSLVNVGRGRPSKRYSISYEGRDRISSKYDVIVDLLTTAMNEDMGSSASKKLYESAGQMLATDAGKLEDSNSLLRTLDGLGFQPQLRRDGSKELIISRNCPILKLALKFPELTCDTFHTVFLRQLLGKPELLLWQTMARGAPECVHLY
jgi:predicted ArsR family transcriptional regulator